MSKETGWLLLGMLAAVVAGVYFGDWLAFLGVAVGVAIIHRVKFPPKK